MKASFLTLVFALLSIFFFHAQSPTDFSGKIRFKQTKGSAQISYNYFVKGEMIRIEEFNEDDKLVGTQLVNIKKKEHFVISPERKLFLKAKKRRSPANLEIDVTKTTNKKTILGFDCFEVVAVNQQQDRKIVYWITKDNYSFFKPLISVLNRKEKQQLYFQKIKGMENCIPLKVTEYVISTGRPISTSKVLSIDSKSLEDSLFMVPESYSEFEN